MICALDFSDTRYLRYPTDAWRRLSHAQGKMSTGEGDLRGGPISKLQHDSQMQGERHVGRIIRHDVLSLAMFATETTPASTGSVNGYHIANLLACAERLWQKNR